jgi:protocatechuate 3,4-dioxygenase beta subunit
MSKTGKINRRTILAAGAGMAASAVAANVWASEAKPTPSNPEGPFYPKQPQSDKDADLTQIDGHAGRAEGQVIRVTGRVLDDAGQPVEGALVDVWQANTHGRYHHEDDPATAPYDPNFQGWAMVKTDKEGRYSFTTIKPGAYRVDEKWQRPPHIHFKVSRRGHHELTTQMYFSNEPLNGEDRLLNSVPEADRALLLVDFKDRDGVPEGDFPIVLARVG